MSNIKERELKALRDLAAGLPLPVRLIGEPWTDDHVLCCKIGVLLDDQSALPEQDLQEVEIDLWWIGWEGVAAVKYAGQSEQARADLARHLAVNIEDLEEDEDGEEDKTDLDWLSEQGRKDPKRVKGPSK